MKLRLYIIEGNLPSQRAVDNLQKLIEATPGSIQYEIIDMEQQPERAEADNIVAAPTLFRYSPEPAIRLIGDLSDLDRVSTILSLHLDSN